MLICYLLNLQENRGVHAKITVSILNGIIWIARSGAPWRDLPERYGPWETVYSRFRKWIDDGILDNIFRVLKLEAELDELSIDCFDCSGTSAQCRCQKRGPPNEIGHSRGGAQHQNPCGSRCLWVIPFLS